MTKENPLLAYFYTDPTNKQLLERKQQEDAQAADQLNKRFAAYYLKARLISYSDKLARYYGKEFDKKKRMQRNQLQLDSFFESEEEGPVRQIPSDEPEVVDVLTDQIVDILPTEAMKDTYTKMSDKKKEVLHLFTFEQLSNKEIAEKMNCSPQNVSKLKINSLNELKGAGAYGRTEEKSTRRSTDGDGSAD